MGHMQGTHTVIKYQSARTSPQGHLWRSHAHLSRCPIQWNMAVTTPSWPASVKIFSSMAAVPFKKDLRRQSRFSVALGSACQTSSVYTCRS
jgi:hypothetical protein